MAEEQAASKGGFSNGSDRVRDAAKWLVGAFAAIAAILVAGSQLSSLGKLSGLRLAIALAAVVVALLALGFAIWLLLDIMLPTKATLHELASAEGNPNDPVGRIAVDYPELLHGWAPNIAGLRQRYQHALEQRRAAHEGNYQTPPTASDDEVERANNLVTSVGYSVSDVLSVAAYLTLDAKLRSSKRRLVLIATGFAAAVSIAAFAWAANPPEESEGTETASLAGANLSGVRLQGQDLSGADLRSSVLRDGDLRGTNLAGVDASNADWTGIDLRGANLTGADLTNAILENAALQGSDLSDANLTNTDLTAADLTAADTSGATFENATCPDGSKSAANEICP